MVDWLAGKRIKGTSSERTTGQWLSSVGGWKLLGSTSGSGTIKQVTISNPKRYYMVLGKENSASSALGLTVNGNSSSGYTNNYTLNNTQATSTTDLIQLNVGTSHAYGMFTEFINDKSGQTKTFIGHETGSWTSSGNNTALESTGTFSSTGNLSSIEMEAWSGSFSDTRMVVLGYDENDSHTDNFWSQVGSATGTGSSGSLNASISTTHDWYWIQMYLDPTSASAMSPYMTFNSQTSGFKTQARAGVSSANYSDSGTTANIPLLSSTTPVFINMYIGDSIGWTQGWSHMVSQGSASNTAPESLSTNSFHWTGSNITSIQINSSVNLSTNSFIKIYGGTP